MEILCFYAGIVLVCLKTPWPAGFILLALFLRAHYRFVLWFIAGILWSTLHQWYIFKHHLSLDDVIPYAKIQGYITSIPNDTLQKIQFQFTTDHIDNKPINTNLSLSCFNQCPTFKVGQYWQMTVKLKKPSNYANPGSFDYVGGLHARHIDRAGYIRNGSTTLIPSKKNPLPLLTLRTYLAQKLAETNQDESALGILEALTLGITHHINKEEWGLFRRTGTTHLMVISGSHISLVAGLIYFIAKWLWCRNPTFCLRYPAPKMASIFAFLMAFIYALLAGFAVPAQRAIIVCFFLFLRHFCHQRFSAWQSWRYALFTVLVFEPHSVVLPGFYLSFIAVAILISVNARLTWSGFRKTLGLQMACAFGLMPLTLFWFSYGSINGLAANLIAIPWVSFIIVPMGLLMLCCGAWFVIPGFAYVLKWSITFLLTYLHWIDSFAMINVEWSLKHVFTPIMLMIIGSMLLFMPIKRLFIIMVILAITGSMPTPEKIKEGSVRIRILDVGQGLAIAVHTANHTLIYDTGLKYYKGSDMGKMVIIPYLTAVGVNHIDKVIISHPDLDHRGGLLSLEEKYVIPELIVDAPSFYHRGVSCHHYPAWNWDGVTFRFFPLLSEAKSKNNTSCVLQIMTKSGKVLLTGDIEKQAEKYLVDTYGKKLRSSVIVVPHHASKTSSTHQFITQVSPQYAVVSYGFDNHYHFPHQQALQVYQSRKTPIYNTVKCGMITVTLEKDKPLLPPVCYNEPKYLSSKLTKWLN